MNAKKNYNKIKFIVQGISLCEIFLSLFAFIRGLLASQE